MSGGEEHVEDTPLDPAASAADRLLLASVDEIVRAVLDDALQGLSLFGSATLAGLRPDSDLDLLAVVARPTSRAAKEALARRLSDISGRQAGGDRARSVELTIVTSSDVRPWRYPPVMDFQYGDWLRSDFEREHAAVWRPSVNIDLAVLLTMARSSGRAIAGPRPDELLDPVPAADVRRSIIEALPALRAELDADTRNVLLTLARGWSTVATGEIRSKDAAAAWALPRLSPESRTPLAHARDLYVRGGHDWSHVDRRSIAACADELAEGISPRAR